MTKRTSNSSRASSVASEGPGKLTHIPHMLLVGAAGRNAGKTALACSIIRGASRYHRVIGVKVMAVGDERAACPHGDGCGACGTLQGNFSIVEENRRGSGKDTARMLGAGASRAFWLRARSGHLREGVAALMSEVGEGEVVVCESTSARSVIEPAIFLIAKRADSDERKKSARAVWDDADRIVSFDGRSFDLEIEDIRFADGRWALRGDASAIVMAGGESSRMGADKALLDLAGRPMIERIVSMLRPHFRELIIGANDAGKYAFTGVRVVPDRLRGRGPLMGIASTLAASSHDLNFIQACDIPHTELRFVRRMLRLAEGCDAVIPRTPDGHEPLFAVYRKSALAAIDEALKIGDGRISRIFGMCNVKFLDLPEGVRFTNLNTPEEYSSCVRSLAERF
ncbi:MAG: NTP transferase domain-containing protein [Pseudomonadota bacterium]